MAKFHGGMEFRPGRAIRLPAPPPKLPAHALRLFCPSRPEVVTGQVIAQGQVLTHPVRPSECNHVSPVHGTVRSVRQVGVTRGERTLSGYEVTIEPPGEMMPTTMPVEPPHGRKLEAWFSAMQQVGPWGDADGGIGLIPQLKAAGISEPDTLICVGLDSYPPFPVRSTLLVSFPDDAVLGTLVLADLVKAKNVIMLAARSAQVVGRLRNSCRNYRLKLVCTHDVYPAADPTLVAWTHAGRRRVSPGANPVEQGVVMINPWTAIRVGRWFTLRGFDTVRPMMIAWPEADEPMSIAYALPGQPLSSLHNRLRMPASMMRQRVVLGNPMTGHPPDVTGDDAASEPTVPDDELLISVMGGSTPPVTQPCISCGWCADVCPTKLRPYELMCASRDRSDDDYLLSNLPWCIDCGLCSHVCPSALPLAQTLRQANAKMGFVGR